MLYAMQYCTCSTYNFQSMLRTDTDPSSPLYSSCIITFKKRRIFRHKHSKLERSNVNSLHDIQSDTQSNTDTQPNTHTHHRARTHIIKIGLFSKNMKTKRVTFPNGMKNWHTHTRQNTHRAHMGGQTRIEEQLQIRQRLKVNNDRGVLFCDLT